MTSALIGFTGFVGGSLARETQFDLLIHRPNLESLRHARLERLVCAGLPAAKWIANQKPDEDLQNLQRLQSVLSGVTARRFVLISTVDVYPVTRHADETHNCSGGPNHAYGRHRLLFEEFVRKKFPHANIVRLPALFGPGLKKNILYDLLFDNHVERINPASRFQWYPLERLTEDLRTIEQHSFPLVNLCTEPLATGDIVADLFPGKAVGQSPDPPAEYDVRTRFGATFGGDDRYAISAADVMVALRNFVHPLRAGA